jgi:hypothetical protein
MEANVEGPETGRSGEEGQQVTAGETMEGQEVGQRPPEEEQKYKVMRWLLRNALVDLGPLEHV